MEGFRWLVWPLRLLTLLLLLLLLFCAVAAVAVANALSVATCSLLFLAGVNFCPLPNARNPRSGPLLLVNK